MFGLFRVNLFKGMKKFNKCNYFFQLVRYLLHFEYYIYVYTVHFPHILIMSNVIIITTCNHNYKTIYTILLPNITEHLIDVEKINDYFSSVFIDSDLNDLTEQYNDLDHLYGNVCSFILAIIEDVNRALSSINSNASYWDDVSVQMLIYCTPFIDPFKTQIIHVCLEAGNLPKNVDGSTYTKD